jgi:hypothetical protein
MEDSCNPFAKTKMQSFRIYSLMIPAVLLVFILESIYVFMTIPESLGTALTMKGPFPKAKLDSLLGK